MRRYTATQEDEMSQAETVSTVMETSSYQGLPDSVYSNYIRKVSSLSAPEYLKYQHELPMPPHLSPMLQSSLSCDELTELDNDSFLTSLETISVMDRFAWD